MPDDKKAPLIKNRFVKLVKSIRCTTLLKEQKDIKLYIINKLTVCNMCILINILIIALIQLLISLIEFLYIVKTIKLKIEILIAIIITHIFLGCLTIIKIYFTHKLLTICKHFKIHVSKTCVIFITTIIINVFLFLSYYNILPVIEINMFLRISAINLLIAGIIIGIEATYLCININITESDKHV